MRVAIVNDLALAREVLRRLILSVPGYSIAWMAENGEESVRKTAEDRPDIILMDLVMPVMDGAEATRRIMLNTPCPILLVTSSVTGNFNKVYQAMGYGGLDAVNTPTFGPLGEVQQGEGILAQISKLARAKQLPTPTVNRQTAEKTFTGALSAGSARGQRHPLLAIGASTGGPEAIAQILNALPSDFPAGVIVIQHIAADFANSLASWLKSRCCLPVRVAREHEEPRPGEVLIAGTNDHLTLRSDGRLAYTADPVDYPYRPSVDILFESLARHWLRPGVAVLLTGMGSDGARGMLQLRRAGWFTVAQDQSTSVVYGMPKAAVDLQACVKNLPLQQIPSVILQAIK